MKNFVDTSISDLKSSGRAGAIGDLMALSHFSQSAIMEKLLEGNRYQKLSVSYHEYIVALAEKDYLPSDLAKTLSVSNQACNYSINELEKLGLVQRCNTRQGSRSRQLSLSLKGARLIEDGIVATLEVHEPFVRALGKGRLARLSRILETLCERLCLEVPMYRVFSTPEAIPGSFAAARFSLLLSSLSNHYYHAMIAHLSEKGFDGLTRSFRQVFSLIPPEGGRIQHMATVMDVSKQAVAAIAAKLENLGYIRKEIDPKDGRQLILHLSAKGEALLAAAEESVQLLQSSIREMLGEKDTIFLEEALATLTSHMLHDYVPPKGRQERIQKLSDKLLEQLGNVDARILAQRLMALTKV